MHTADYSLPMGLLHLPPNHLLVASIGNKAWGCVCTGWTNSVPTLHNISVVSCILQWSYSFIILKPQTDCSKPEMQFNGPNSGSPIPTLFTLNYKSRQLPGKKQNYLKWCKLYISAEQPKVFLFFPVACSFFKPLRTLPSFLASKFGLSNTQHEASGCRNILLWVLLKLFSLSQNCCCSFWVNLTEDPWSSLLHECFCKYLIGNTQGRGPQSHSFWKTS